MSGEGLVVRGLEREYETRGPPLRVLHGVDLTLAPGRSAAVMGPSGCGKSTLLHIIGTLDRPTLGSVHIDGLDPFTLNEPELAAFRNAAIGFVFQDHHLLPQCSALENVIIPTLVARQRDGGDDARTRAAELLKQVGLAERLDHRPAELSGGERQRVAIARALINRPRLLLADEPTGNLDQDSAAEIAALFADIHRAAGTMLLVVTHSPQLAARFDAVYELQRGGLVEAKSASSRGTN